MSKTFISYFKNYIDKNIIKLILILILLLFIFFKNTLLILLFVFLDFINSYFKRNINLFVPVDFLVIGVLYFSFFVSYKIGFLFALIGFVNRIILAKVEFFHIEKLVSLSIVSYLCSVLNHLNDFKLIFVLLLIGRMVSEFIINLFVFQDINQRKLFEVIIYNIGNIVLILTLGNTIKNLII